MITMVNIPFASSITLFFKITCYFPAFYRNSQSCGSVFREPLRVDLHGNCRGLTFSSFLPNLIAYITLPSCLPVHVSQALLPSARSPNPRRVSLPLTFVIATDECNADDKQTCRWRSAPQSALRLAAQRHQHHCRHTGSPHSFYISIRAKMRNEQSALIPAWILATSVHRLRRAPRHSPR